MKPSPRPKKSGKSAKKAGKGSRSSKGSKKAGKGSRKSRGSRGSKKAKKPKKGGKKSKKGSKGSKGSKKSKKGSKGSKGSKGKKTKKPSKGSKSKKPKKEKKAEPKEEKEEKEEEAPKDVRPYTSEPKTPREVVENKVITIDLRGMKGPQQPCVASRCRSKCSRGSCQWKNPCKTDRCHRTRNSIVSFARRKFASERSLFRSIEHRGAERRRHSRTRAMIRRMRN